MGQEAGQRGEGAQGRENGQLSRACCPGASGRLSILEAWRRLPLGVEGTSPVRVLSPASREKGEEESPSCLPFSQTLSAQNVPDAEALRTGWRVLNPVTLMDSTPRAHCLQTGTRGPHEMRWPPPWQCHPSGSTCTESRWVPSTATDVGRAGQRGRGPNGGRNSEQQRPRAFFFLRDTVTPSVWANHPPYKRLSLR